MNKEIVRAVNEQQVLNAVNKLVPSLQSVESAIQRPLSLGEKQIVSRAFECQRIGIHWFIKLEWHSKYKIPASKEIAKLIKPRGELLQQIFSLCKNVHCIPQMA
ncbi:hypothetical protein F7734_00665 [Scytonema sp. UIC 10036]|uniref:hypothetical protein n=1 Tax=Scytonema sp. UIC 10036 TaxID=2304196 RepID=UPI0012DABABE|nr:hypothetical protein [Scytonema sp. UIC 10036]MUG91090.1 hypothetical protein [Scytonema sp. UIC 10036]